MENCIGKVQEDAVLMRWQSSSELDEALKCLPSQSLEAAIIAVKIYNSNTVVFSYDDCKLLYNSTIGGPPRSPRGGGLKSSAMAVSMCHY